MDVRKILGVCASSKRELQAPKLESSAESKKNTHKITKLAKEASKFVNMQRAVSKGRPGVQERKTLAFRNRNERKRPRNQQNQRYGELKLSPNKP